jgi:hypothetical protein
MKAASLTARLLSPKGRAMPAALIDQIVGEPRPARGDTRDPELPRREPELLRAADEPPRRELLESRPQLAAGPVVVLPLPASVIDEARHVVDHAHRKKLSLRLEPMRHFRLKLVSYHLGLTAQELMTRALDQYIDHVAPELAQTTPLAVTATRESEHSAAEERAGETPAPGFHLPPHAK